MEEWEVNIKMMEYWSDGILEFRSREVSYKQLLRVAGFELRVEKITRNPQRVTRNDYFPQHFDSFPPTLTSLGISEHIFRNPRLLKNFIFLKKFNYKSNTSYYNILFKLLFLITRSPPFNIHILNNNSIL